MTFLETYMELNELAVKARELSDKLNKEIGICLEDLNKFLSPDSDEIPAMVEQYEPIDKKK